MQVDEETHVCPDKSVFGCKTCCPYRPGDYCHACFWNGFTNDKHIWWCRKAKERK